MPRDSNGTYSLPAGNPVVTLTPISSTWANTTLDDIGNALTDSLDRAGSGAMTGQLKLANGTSGAPALTWGTDTTSGLYRAAANDFRFSVASADKLTITSALISTSVPFGLPNGAAATPAIYFTSDTDTGFYRVGADSLGVAVGGAFVGGWIAGQYVSPDGSAASPAYSFNSDTNTGIYRIAADSIGISTNGTLRVTVDTVNLTTALPALVPNGAVGAPAVAFSGDTDTGVYRIGANSFGIAAGGVLVSTFEPTLVQSEFLHRFVDGTAGAPGITFSADSNTGLYRIASDQLGFTEGGVGYRIGYRGVPAFGQNAGYTFQAADVGQQTTANTAGNFTVPPSVFASGDVFTFINTTGSNCTLVQGAGVTFRLLGTAATTGNRTVASFGMATIIAQNSTVFLVGGPGVS